MGEALDDDMPLVKILPEPCREEVRLKLLLQLEKKPLPNSFFIFSRLHRSRLQEQFSTKEPRVINKELGKEWKNLSGNQKKLFEKLSSGPRRTKAVKRPTKPSSQPSSDDEAMSKSGEETTSSSSSSSSSEDEN